MNVNQFYVTEKQCINVYKEREGHKVRRKLYVSTQRVLHALVSDIELHLMGNGEQLFPNGECNNQAFE